MKVKELIKELEKLPQDKTIYCQIIPSEGDGAWRMFHELHDIPDSPWVQLKIYHPELKRLPDIDF